jgi:predicted phosphodiesterase
VRRFALYSDIHGNIAALDAVLAEIESSGLDERYCLGDLVGYGPEPGAVIARVRETGDPVIRGNYDDGVGYRKGQCGCYYGTPEAKADGHESYLFTDGVLDDAEHDYLTSLLDDIRFEEAGVRVLLCHGSPRRINEYLMLDRPEQHLAKLAREAEADLVCFGHIHIPYHRLVMQEGGLTAHFVSDGSVGRPKDGDPRACWAEVLIGDEAEVSEVAVDDPGVRAAGEGAAVGVVFHRVAYDAEAVAREVVEAGLPERLADVLLTG